VRQHPDDPEVLTRLGLIDQERGAIGSAEQRYRHALSEDPFSAVAASNLGVILAGHGDLAGAVALWAPTYDRNPQLSDVGLNLAAAECEEGRLADARATLARLLRHDPDRGRARAMKEALNPPAPHCAGP
jgi:Flp pilus assembly protein TadD